MQSKTIIFLFGLSILTLVSAVGVTEVFAQTTTSSSTLKATSSPTQIKPENTSLRKVLSRERQQRVTNLVANVSNRFEAVIERLQSIARRMDMRIQKMEQAGLDVTIAKNKLTEATASLTRAQTDLKDIDATVASVITSEKPQEAWRGVRTVLTETSKNIAAAKQSLHDVIIILTQAQPAQSVSGTLSPQIANEENPADTQ